MELVIALVILLFSLYGIEFLLKNKILFHPDVFSSFAKLVRSGIMEPNNEAKLQTLFMQFSQTYARTQLNIAPNSLQPLYIPKLGNVVITANPSHIATVYAPEHAMAISQTDFFANLKVLLGDNNLMCMPPYQANGQSNAQYQMLRSSIFKRNNQIKSHIPAMVTQHFAEYKHSAELGDTMDALSRRVLIETYFGQEAYHAFEGLDFAQISRAILANFFSFNATNQDKLDQLMILRNDIFNLGVQLIQRAPSVVDAPQWLNQLLLNVAQRYQPDLTELTRSQALALIEYAKIHDDDKAQEIENVVNESLFIPLLGFDATGTVLSTSLRILLQDTRIYNNVMAHIQEGKIQDPASSIPWLENESLTYLDAVITEALRLAPPAPMIPEKLTHDIHFAEGVVKQGTIMMFPLAVIHQNQQNYPDINLNSKGRQSLGKNMITASDVFPERWLESDLTDDAQRLSSRAALQKSGALLTFKAGVRACPGMRLALTEIKAMLIEILTHYHATLESEAALTFQYQYEKPLERHGAAGTLQLQPQSKKSVAAPSA